MSASSPQAQALKTLSVQPRKKRSRLRRVLIVLAVILLVARLSLSVMLPGLVAGLAEDSGLTCSWRSLELSFFGGELELWHLTLDEDPGQTGASPDVGDENALLFLEYVRADVAMLHLFVGELVVRRVEADGVDVLLELDENGQPRILETLARAEAAGDTRAEEPEPGRSAEVARGEPGKVPKNGGEQLTEPEAFDPDEPLPALLPAIELDALRLQHVQLRVRETEGASPLDLGLSLNLRVSDLSAPERSTRLELTIQALPTLDVLSVRGEMNAVGRTLDAQLRVDMQGLQLSTLGQILAPLGVEPVAFQQDFGFSAAVHVRPAEGAGKEGTGLSPLALAVSAQLDDLALSADGVESAAIDQVLVEVAALDGGMLDVSRVLVQGVRAHAELRPSGALRVAGVDLGPTAGSGRAKPEPIEDEPQTDAGAGMQLARLNELGVHDLELRFVDSSLPDARSFVLSMPGLEIMGLNAQAPEEEARLSVELLLPGILDRVSVIGALAPFATPQRYTLAVDGAGLNPVALDPYLGPAGITPDGEPTQLRFELGAELSSDDTGVAAEAWLRDLSLQGAETWLALGEVALSGVQKPAAGDSLRVAEVRVSGGRVFARRSLDGSLALFGMRMGEAPAGDPSRSADVSEPLSANARAAGSTPGSAARTAVTVPATADPGSGSGFRLELGRLLLNDHAVVFDDERYGPLSLEHVRAVAGPLQFGPGALAGTSQLLLSGELPGILEKLKLSGELLTSESRLELGLDVGLSGITAQALAPYLEPAGVVSELEAGRVTARVDVGVGLPDELAGRGLTLDARVSDIVYGDGEQRFLSVSELRVDGLEASRGRLDLARVAVVGPVLRARRAADGSLEVGGFRLGEAAAESGREPDSEPAAEPGTSEASPTSTAQTTAPSPATVTSLDRLDVSGARVEWQDAGVQPAVQLQASLDAHVTQLVLGERASPAEYALTLGLPGLMERLSLTGQIAAGPEQQRVQTVLDVQGLQVRGVQSYLPPELVIPWSDGRLSAEFELQHGPAESGGNSVHATLSNLSFGEAAEGAGHTSYFGVEHLALRAPRLDPEGGLIHIESLELTGVTVDGAQRPDGGLTLFGIELSAPVSEGQVDVAQDVSGAAPEAGDEAGDEAGEVAGEVAQGATSGKPGASELPSTPDSMDAPAVDLPEFRLDRLDLQLARLRLVRNEGPPLGISNLRLQTLEPIVQLGEDPESQGTIHLGLTGSVEPDAAELALDLKLAPFAPEPTLQMTLDVTELRGSGLLQWAPGLEQTVDASGLTEGAFHAGLELVAHVARRSALELRLEEGLGVEVALTDVALREHPDGEPTLGVDEVLLDVARFVPHTGGLHVRSLEIQTPRAHLVQRADGLHVAGLRLIPAPEEAEDGSGEEAPEDVVAQESSASELPVEPTVELPVEEEAERRVDEFLVTGIDVSYTDETTEPVFILPLRELEVDARNLTSRALKEPLSLRTSTLLGIGAAEDEQATIGEVALLTDVSLFPELTGGVKFNVSSLEVLPFSGPASAAGVTLNKGVVDVTTGVYFPGDGVTEVDTSLQLTDLDISEGPDGPLERILSLPAPLDVVLFVLRDESGTIGIPLSFEMDEDGLSLLSLSGAAVSALSSLVVSAVASSPFRMASALGELTGLSGAEEERDLEPVLVDYAPASPFVLEPTDAAFSELHARLIEDPRLVVTLRHEFGKEDVALVSQRANPSEQTCLALLSELRAHKADLLSERAAAEEAARAALFTRGAAHGAEERRLLGEVDRRLGETERALDELVEVLRPGADRKRKTRTKTASLELGNLRLAETRREILGSNAREAARLAERVRVVRARYKDAELPSGGRVTLEFSAKTAE